MFAFTTQIVTSFYLQSQGIVRPGAEPILLPALSKCKPACVDTRMMGGGVGPDRERLLCRRICFLHRGHHPPTRHHTHGPHYGCGLQHTDTSKHASGDASPRCTVGLQLSVACCSAEAATASRLTHAEHEAITFSSPVFRYALHECAPSARAVQRPDSLCPDPPS